MRRTIVHWLVSALALALAAAVVPGIRISGNGVLAVGGMAIVFGLVNAIVRPVLKLLSCALIVLSLGLFLFVVNAIALWLSSAIAVHWFHLGFHVDGFLSALEGAVIVTVVSWALSAAYELERHLRRSRR
ncbi:MAG TPA: phage holin family protein [Candidatus Dormibacteraeota bacterium]|jgi:putative membrane protein|nr:phage holin family protein [Candidatus Dormibacteraeota bacterium]